MSAQGQSIGSVAYSSSISDFKNITWQYLLRCNLTKIGEIAKPCAHLKDIQYAYGGDKDDIDSDDDRTYTT